MFARQTLALLLAAGLAVPALAGAPRPAIRTLLLTGANNHDWQFTSAAHKATLEATGRFDVTIVTDPAGVLASNDLADVDLFVLDYNGPRWGDAAERNFSNAVADGAGVVVIHAANNPFPGWADYERIVGLCWRDGTGHGKFHAFNVTYTDRQHPVTNGLADMVDHHDELYHRLVNVQNVPYHTLATAFSSTESGGIGADQPMAITLQFGKGRVFHTPLGHVWPGEEHQRVSVTDPQFRILLARGAEWAANGAVTIAPEWAQAAAQAADPAQPAAQPATPAAAEPDRSMPPSEMAPGWLVLFSGFDGRSFRGFKKDGFPDKGWIVQDGTLHHAAGGGGGDIITNMQFGDFELYLEWKVAPKGNSGIMYRVSEDRNHTWETGPEMQVLDDEGHRDGLDPKTSAGSLYALYAPENKVLKPAGEWNAVYIIAQGSKVEHWLNGVKIVSFDMDSDDYKQRIANSKFKDMPGFGKNRRGHIALQDHGDAVWYRNIRVKPLD